MAILTSARVGITMSGLEIRARKGDPFAQDEIERQAFTAASITKKIQKEGLTRLQAQAEVRRK
jgi:hypothetical protein